MTDNNMQPQNRYKAPARADVQTISGMMSKMQNELKAALPEHLDSKRLARIALTELRKVPKLQQCDALSFMAAIMQSAQLGLEPGGSLGHVYLIPYGNQCQFIIGYRGMIELARRSGQIISLTAHEVFENDKFEFEYGLNEKLSHSPAFGERGKLMGVYAIAKLVGGGYQMDFMSNLDVEKIRLTSKAKDSGPWKTHYGEMAKKTVIRRLFKYLPVSIEIQKAVQTEERSEIDVTSAKEILADFNISEEVFTVDKDTGEILNNELTEQEQADILAKELAGE